MDSNGVVNSYWIIELIKAHCAVLNSENKDEGYLESNLCLF
jgi:hypothetical protein